MICHILFIHSSLDQHLCCFHLLDIVDTVSMNIGVQISVWFPAFNAFVYTEVELLHQILILCCCCCFWWSIVIFSAVTVPFYIPTSKAQVVFQYPYMQVNNCLLVGWLVFFYSSPSNAYEVLVHYWFDYIPLRLSNVKHIFMCILDIRVFSLEKCLFKSCLLMLYYVEVVSFYS